MGTEKETVGRNGWNKLAAGGLAGGVTKTVIAPLERIRIMCQTGASDGFFRTARCVNTNEGLAGFWRGNTANLMRVVPNKAVLFASNDLLQSMMRNDDGTLPSYAAIAAGSGAGLITVIGTYPLDLVRGRLAGKLAQQSNHSGVINTMRTTVREEGFQALYRGVGPTLIGAIPYEGIKFGCYDAFIRMAPHTTREIITRDGESESVRETSVGWKVVCGGAAGTVAGVVTYPNDTVRRRLQLQGGSSNEILYKNALDCWKTMWKKEGIASYFRGMSANLIRVVPNHAIQFGMYGLFVDIFAKYH